MANDILKDIEDYIELRISDSKRSIDEDVLNVLDRWYQSYQKIITFLGTSSGIVLLYMGLHILELLPDESWAKSSIADTIRENRFLIYAGVGSLILSIVAMVVCLVTTYNWYKTGLRQLLTNSKEADQLKQLLGDDMQYRVVAESMRFWGRISLITGVITGACFALGIIFYALGVYQIFPHLIYSGQ